MLKRLWRDEGGAVLSVELILLLVILVIGLVAGMTALRDAIDLKLVEVAAAVSAINPSFAVQGVGFTALTCGGGVAGGAGVAGMGFIDSALATGVTWTSCPTAYATLLAATATVTP